jgi:CNT family concentrative nucleoside transporter
LRPAVALDSPTPPGLVCGVHLKFVSLLGLVVLIGLAWACSFNRRRFPWRTVLAGLALQFAVALFILETAAGKAAFEAAQSAFANLLNCAAQGAELVFGPLAREELLNEKLGPGNGFVFVVTVSATIILVSALSSFLYHYGILQRVVRAIAWVMQRVMGASGSESLAAAANIFMGQTEAPLVIKPYLKRMTQSELMALMVGGMATIAGGVLAAYVGFGISAGHLLTASVMSAPAALMIAKVMLPESAVSDTAAGASAKVPRETYNGIEALCRGAADGVMLAINVMAMLIAFVAVVALANLLLGWVQSWFHVAQPVKLETIFGWLNAPFAWLIGVPAKDCQTVGRILGERIVLNEFIGYLSLGGQLDKLDPRSVTLTTYALCGFANFSSIAIQIGGIGALAPERRKDLAKLGLRAMLGGLIACYLTATVVGILL